MDDEYALCWNNFQETIATGFQNLYDRGDLVDVTLAVEGKLLHAHKIVLAICSPYFQEMFSSNPCKHPILILKDIGFGVMCELLQFMYQGAVSVKQTELPTFLKIAQTLQIRGLANSSNIPQPASSQTASLQSEKQNAGEKSPNQLQGSSTSLIKSENTSETGSNNTKASNQTNSSTQNSATSSQHTSQPKSSPESSVLKRLNEYSTDALSIYSKKQRSRNLDGGGSSGSSADDMHSDSMDQMHHDDVFIPPIPQISMTEPRFDLNNVKREHSEQPNSPGPIRGPQLPPSFPTFDYNAYTAAAAAAVKQQIEYPNDLHMGNDYSKNNFNNHMDIPAIAPGERWLHGKLEFMLSQRGKPLLVHDGHTFGIQYVRKDKKYWQCNLSRKFNCKARVTTTETGDIIVTNNEHCHTEIRQHLRKDYQRNKVMMNALINQNQITMMAALGNDENLRRLMLAGTSLNFSNGLNIPPNNNNNNFGLKDLSIKSKTPDVDESGSDVEEKHHRQTPNNGNAHFDSP